MIYKFESDENPNHLEIVKSQDKLLISIHFSSRSDDTQEDLEAILMSMDEAQEMILAIQKIISSEKVTLI